MTSSAPRRRVSAFVASLLVALVALLVLPASPAFAHDELVSTDPPADAVLDALPEQITFTYSADILTEQGTAVVEVTDATGASLTEGTPVVSGTDVTQTLTGSASGAVTVKWRVVSSDGHPIDGTFSFTVNGATPTPTPTATASTPTATPTAPATTTPTATTPDATATPSETASSASPLPWILLVVALVIVAGAIVWLFVARGRSGSSGGGSTGTAGR
ncbi:copper resistance CopC family protein [Microbacterium sp. S1037]|uniref:copper resistance CopC family protein n=1 Tax=Microbacterium sp. S1037 TaxID=3398227 RepID=UPI003AAE51F5